MNAPSLRNRLLKYQGWGRIPVCVTCGGQVLGAAGVGRTLADGVQCVPCSQASSARGEQRPPAPPSSCP